MLPLGRNYSKYWDRVSPHFFAKDAPERNMTLQSVEKDLGENVTQWIGNFLYHEGFPPCEVTQKGLLHLLDSIDGYTEEGQRLYPEVFLTTSLKKALASLPNNQLITIDIDDLTEKTFKKALKRCAPLAKGSWSIFLEILGGKISYGLVSSEVSELSASLHRQLVGDMGIKEDVPPMAYVRAVGSKVVEITGIKAELRISLSLGKKYKGLTSEIEALATVITSSVDSSLQGQALSFFSRLLEDSFKEGHGSIIAVVADLPEALAAFKLNYPDGAYLPTSVDIVQKLSEALETQTRQASSILREYALVVKGMVSHDGISVFTTTGKVIAFNVFLRDTAGVSPDESGGARTRAFTALKSSGLTEASFFRSHDGRIDFWEKHNG